MIFVGKSLISSNNKGKKQQDTVITEECVSGDIKAIITGNGTLTPNEQYEVKSLVKGEVIKAPFEEGDKVKKGDLLYKISTKTVDNSVKTALLTVEKAESAYKDALGEKDKLVITSNETGYVKEMYVKTGDTVQDGSVMAEVYDDGNLELEVLFPKQEVKQTIVGSRAYAILDGTSEEVSGTVKKILNQTQSLEGGIVGKKVVISIKNPGGLREGDIASARIGQVYSSNVGSFKATTKGQIKATYTGKIASLAINEGDYVTTGSQVATLSSQEIDKRIKETEDGMKEAEINLQNQKDQLGDYAVKSPISGSIINKNKKVGDTIDPQVDTQNPMAIVYDMSSMKFDMNVDELDIMKVKLDQKVIVTAASYPEEEFEGVVEKISLKGITENGVTSYPVTIKLLDYRQLLPGMNVSGKIITDESNNTLMIPSGALQNGNIVYVKREENNENTKPESTADSQPTNTDIKLPKGFVAVSVEIGINDGTNVEIKSGLNQGDIVYIPYAATEVTGWYD